MADRAPPADGWAGVTDRFLSAVVHSLTSNNEALAGVAARVVTLNAKADTISTKVDALPTRAQFDTLSTKVDQLTTKVNQLTAAVQGLAAASAAQIAAFGPATTIQAYNDKTRHKNRLRNEKHLPLLPLMDQHGALVIIRTPGALRTTGNCYRFGPKWISAMC